MICDDELRVHDPLDYQGCRNYTVNNLYTNASATLLLTCQGCVPRHCDHGEHDCVPVSCEVDGSMHGGYTVAAAGGGGDPRRSSRPARHLGVGEISPRAA